MEDRGSTVMRRGNKCHYINLILINPFPISLFSDSPLTNYCKLPGNCRYHVVAKPAFSYISASERYQHWGMPCRQWTTSVFHQGESKWRMLCSLYNHFSIPSQVNWVKAPEEVSVLSIAFGLGPAQERWGLHRSSAQLPRVLRWMSPNRRNRNQKANVVLAYTGAALTVLSLSCPGGKLCSIPHI